jgi:hypothetical protein
MFLFCVIHDYRTESTFVLAGASIAGWIAVIQLFLSIKFGLRVTAAADSMLSSFKANISAGQIKEESRFIRSCTSLVWNLGGSFTVKNDSALVILHDVILNNTITLLMTF